MRSAALPAVLLLAVLLLPLPLHAMEGLPELPVEWRVLLTGSLGETPFGEVAATLALSAPSGGDENPLQLRLLPDDPAQPGALTVRSFLPDRLGGSTFGRIKPTDRGLVLVLIADAEPGGYPLWTLAPSTRADGSPGLPGFAQARNGSLELSWAAGLRGTVELQGRNLFGRPVTYRATLQPLADDAPRAPSSSSPAPPATGPEPAPESFEGLRERASAAFLAGRDGEAAPIVRRAREALRERYPTIPQGPFGDTFYIEDLKLSHLLALSLVRHGDFPAAAEALTDHLAARQALADRAGHWYEGLGGEDARYQALAMMDLWRARQESDAERIWALEQGQQVFAALLRYFADLGMAKEALVVSEASRGRALADLLARRSDPAAAVWRRAVRSPSFAELHETVRKLQAPVVQYFAGDDVLVVLLILPQGEVRLFEQPVSRRELSERVRELHGLLSAPATCADLDAAACAAREARLDEILLDLHTALVPDGLREVLSDPEPQPVVVVPHGPLFAVPFPALRDRSGEVLATRWAVAMAPSILALRHLPAPSATDRRLLALVDPEVSHASDLPRLKATAEGFHRIAALYPASAVTLFTGRAATEARLSQAADHQVLYLAMHADQHRDETGGPALILSRGADGDGFLEPVEIARRDLPLELTVLAGCETHLGDVSSDGVYSLARAFLVAGSRGVLASLWSAEESSTLDLMEVFHDGWLRQGLPAAEALRVAQLAVAATTNPPQRERWALYTLIGDWR